MLGAEQVQLLGAPEGEADLLAVADPELGHLLGDLEDGRGAAAVVVDAGAGDDRVEVGTDEHHPVGVAGRRVGDDVAGGPGRVDLGHGGDMDDHPAGHRLGVEGGGVGEAQADHRDLEGAAEGADEQLLTTRVALVEDDDRVVAGLNGVGRLLREGAGAALDERDPRLVGRGGGEVAVLTARGRARVGVGGITMSLVGTTTPVTSPVPEKSNVPVS